MSAPSAFESAFDFTAMLRAFSQARVEDFIRYVGRRMEERPDLAGMDFKTGWHLMIGGYGELCLSNPVVEDGDDDE